MNKKSCDKKFLEGTNTNTIWHATVVISELLNQDSETKNRTVPQMLTIAKELKKKELTIATELEENDLMLIFANTSEFVNNKMFKEFFFGNALIEMPTPPAIDASVKTKTAYFEQVAKFSMQESRSGPTKAEMDAKAEAEKARKRKFAEKTAKFGG